MEQISISPQPGFQYRFLSCPADIAFGGGSAGAGKTFALLFEAMRHIGIRGYSGTIFRRTYPEIDNPGGLWDESLGLYSYVNGKYIVDGKESYLKGVPTKSNLEWSFRDKTNREKSKIVFRHIQRDDDVMNYQGSQLPFIGFDELTHFPKEVFLFMMSRNRSTCGIRPYIRCTCNPDADSWIAEWIDWWLDEEGYINPERDGIIRYFTIDKDKLIWGDSKGEVIEKAKYKFDLIQHENKEDLVKSFTFIKGDIHDNKILTEKNPEYLGSLLALSEEEQMRLYRGNWKVKVEKNMIFNYTKFQDVFLNDWAKSGQRYITADIATTGRDLFIIFVWDNKRLIDIKICSSNNGKEAIEMMNYLRIKHSVPNSNVLFDADGVGGGMTGWIMNCVEFHALKSPVGKQNYANIKHQCYFNLSYCINGTNGKTSDDMYYITPEVASYIPKVEMTGVYKGRTIKWILEHQMKAIREDRPDIDGKLQVIRKDEQKALINGVSPDFMDVWMMREWFSICSINNDFVDYR